MSDRDFWIEFRSQEVLVASLARPPLSSIHGALLGLGEENLARIIVIRLLAADARGPRRPG
jgi:hypothetical protein